MREKTQHDVVQISCGPSLTQDDGDSFLKQKQLSSLGEFWFLFWVFSWDTLIIVPESECLKHDLSADEWDSWILDSEER